jgi:Skp family chaperone for outer membrane proteins
VILFISLFRSTCLKVKFLKFLLFLYKEKTDKKKYEAEITAFQTKLLEAQKYAQQSKIKLEKAHSQGIMQINKYVIEIVAEICSKKGCNVVLPSSQLVYAADNLNISPDVLNELNAKIKSIKISF